MEIIIEHENDLELSWHPSCGWIEGYTYVVGIRGATEKLGPNESPKPPNSLVFNIRFKNKNDVQLLKTIWGMLNELKTTDQITINSFGYHTEPLIKERGNLKAGYQNEISEMGKKNALIQEKYSILVGQLEELGCYCSKLGKPTYQTIPDDWYEWREYIDTERFSISICCHNGTKFYQYLQSNGILDKYFPEEYKNWKFYK
jgi:hypothetical protein